MFKLHDRVQVKGFGGRHGKVADAMFTRFYHERDGYTCVRFDGDPLTQLVWTENLEEET